jgi:alkyl hydroperoxide reductase subunit D
MRLSPLIDALPPYARDVARNLAALEAETVLSAQQQWGAVLASACAAGVPVVIRAAEAAALDAGLSPEAIAAARGAAAIMAQNNIYFRAVDLLDDPVLEGEPSHLRMGIVQKPGVDPVDFHLWTLAASAIFGCEVCLKAQAETLRRAGVGPAALSAALRTAALIHAAARTLAAEAARA